MAQKNLKNFDNNKLNDINVSNFNSAFFLSPIEIINKEPNKDNNYLQILENQSIKIEDDYEPIPNKKDFQTPKSIDTSLKNCLGQDLLKHLDESPMQQQKLTPNVNGNASNENFGNIGNNKNSFFYKKMNNNEENEFLNLNENGNSNLNNNNIKINKNILNDYYTEEKWQLRKFEKDFELINLPGVNIQIVKKKIKDDFFIGMPLETEEAYFINYRYFTKQIMNNEINEYLNNRDNDIYNNVYAALFEDYENDAFINIKYLDYFESQKIENLKRIEKFEKILKIEKGNLYVLANIRKNRSFYLHSINEKIKNYHNQNFENFYIVKEKEKSRDEKINLIKSGEFRNEFMDQNKNYINFNYELNHNDSSTCKNINNIENEENIYSSIFSNNKIKKSNSTNYLGEFENKIPYDPDLFSTDNTNLERIFHSPNFYNFNNSNFHSKEKIIFEENLNTKNKLSLNKNPLSNLFSHNKKNSLSNNNLKKYMGNLNENKINIQNNQAKFIGLMKPDILMQNNNNNNYNLLNKNFENSQNNKNQNKKNFFSDKKFFDESTSAYSNMQNNMPPFSASSEYSREIQSNNLFNKNKNSFLYPNYSDFSDQINIPNLNVNSNNLKASQKINPYSNNPNNNNNEVIFEHHNDYESENFGINNFDEFKKQKDSLYNDIEGEGIINNFLNDEISYTPNRRDKCDESFDKRNFETFDCCNIDSFITPRQNINISNNNSKNNNNNLKKKKIIFTINTS